MKIFALKNGQIVNLHQAILITESQGKLIINHAALGQGMAEIYVEDPEDVKIKTIINNNS
jgi:hypothetical protein